MVHIESKKSSNGANGANGANGTHGNEVAMESNIPIPPDGGFGWVVVMASFLIHIVTDGITYSFGVMYIELLAEFNEGKGYTSWILSLLCGLTLCSGPISSSFVNKYGCRAVTIAGAILASGCLLVSFYAKNVLTLIITIGVGCGCGLGLIYLPAIVSVSSYFEKRRSIAIGIAVAGSGLGTFIFAPLVTFFIGQFGWRKTLLVLSGIVLNCAVFGALFRPLTSSVRVSEQSEQNDQKYEVESIQSNNQNGIEKRQKQRLTHVPSVHAIPEEGQMIRSQSVGHSMTGRKMSTRSRPDDTRCMLSQPLLTGRPMDTVYENRPLSESRRRSSNTLSRPDIFYQGSLYNIPDFKSQSELATDAENGVYQRENNDDFSSRKVCCGCIPADSHETFLEMLNFGLLTDPIFVVFGLSNFSTCLGFYVIYFCLADRAIMLGLTTEQASYLLATIGIANTIGRIVLGYISDKSWVNRLWVYSTCLFICGVATASSTLCYDFYSLAVYSATFGFTIGAYVGLTSVILVDLLGLGKLTNAFGLLLLFQGIASFVGPPIVGFLYDKSNSYTPGFIFAGSMIAFSGFVLFFIPTLQRYFARRRNAKANIKNLTVS